MGFKLLISALVLGNRTIIKDVEKAEEFNKYFCSAFSTDDGNPPQISEETPAA